MLKIISPIDNYNDTITYKGHTITFSNCVIKNKLNLNYEKIHRNIEIENCEFITDECSICSSMKNVIITNNSIVVNSSQGKEFSIDNISIVSKNAASIICKNHKRLRIDRKLNLKINTVYYGIIVLDDSELRIIGNGEVIIDSYDGIRCERFSKLLILTYPNSLTILNSIVNSRIIRCMPHSEFRFVNYSFVGFKLTNEIHVNANSKFLVITNNEFCFKGVIESGQETLMKNDGNFQFQSSNDSSMIDVNKLVLNNKYINGNEFVEDLTKILINDLGKEFDLIFNPEFPINFDKMFDVLPSKNKLKDH